MLLANHYNILVCISDEGTNATVGTRVGTWVTEASTRLLTTLTPLISQPAHADAFDDSHMPVSTSMMTAGEQEIVLEYREVEEDLHYQYVTVTLPTDTTDPQTDAAFVPLPPVSPPNSTDDKAANSEKKVHEQTSTPAPVVDKEAAVERKGQGWWAKSVPCGEEYLLHWDPEVRNACQFSIRNFLASEVSLVNTVFCVSGYIYLQHVCAICQRFICVVANRAKHVWSNGLCLQVRLSG